MTNGLVDCLILTCERDRNLADLVVAGLARFCPGVRPVIVMDTDKSTEIDLPPEVRDVCRRVPYVRRVFDFPHIATTETYVSLDSDCLIYREPTELNEFAFQGIPGYEDEWRGLDLWRELDCDMPLTIPRFCSGIYRCERSMFLDAKELACDYIRRCIFMGYDRMKYPGVLCEQSLVAGLWRMKYPANPLPPERYPYGLFRPGCAIWHMSSPQAASAHGQAMIGAYEALI